MARCGETRPCWTSSFGGGAKHVSEMQSRCRKVWVIVPSKIRMVGNSPAIVPPMAASATSTCFILPYTQSISAVHCPNLCVSML